VAAIRRAALLLGVLAAGLALVTPAQAALRFERCGGYGFACARLSVPLDRSGAVPGHVSLLVKRVAARQRGGATLPPLVVLAGGPGQSATDAFGGQSLDLLYAAYAKRDLIVFDQRGTGRSGLLRCPRLERVNLLRAGPAAGECARSLGSRRAFYTSRDSTDDLDAIRRRLGAQRLALFGTSYGTRVALAYAKRYRIQSSGWCSTRWSSSSAPTRTTWTRSRPCRGCCARCARGSASGPAMSSASWPLWSTAWPAQAAPSQGTWWTSEGGGTPAA
jgi:pimeloyl-ACP methyl ester carboxylesterase